MTNLTELWKTLRAHDWYYEMSDDHNVWRRGQKERAFINKLVKELGQDGLDLFGKVADYYNKGEKFPNPPGVDLTELQEHIDKINTTEECKYRQFANAPWFYIVHGIRTVAEFEGWKNNQ